MIPKYQSQSLPKDFSKVLLAHLGIVPSEVTNFVTAANFLRAKQMATLWGGTELPSLQEALGGELVPRATLVSSPVIGKAWGWAKSLIDSEEVVLVKLFRLRATFISQPLWPALRELCPRDPETLWRTGELSTAAHHIATVLLDQGPTNTLELQQIVPRRFPILPKSLKKGLRELEEKLLIYPQRLGEHHDGKDVNTWEFLWRGLSIKDSERLPSRGAAVARLIEATFRAAGVSDAREASRWFPGWKHESRHALSALLKSAEVRILEDHPNLVFWPGFIQAKPDPDSGVRKSDTHRLSKFSAKGASAL